MPASRLLWTAIAIPLLALPAAAQVPVRDDANLTVARENARSTSAIKQSNDEILKRTQDILKALSGQRTGEAQGNMVGAGLGGSSVSGAPSWGSLMQGGQMNFGSLGSGATGFASTLMNGLQLAQSLQRLFGQQSQTSGSVDQAYLAGVNTAGVLTALTSAASQGVQNRSGQFTSIGGQIGTTQDVKGSVDQNSQLQVQTGLTINELIGVTNGAVAALNTEQIQRITRQSETARFLTYDSADANPFARTGAAAARR